MAKTSGKGYDPNKDYSKELQRKDLTSAQRSQLERERQNKINDKYGGVEPNMTGSSKTYSQTYGKTGSTTKSSSSSGSSATRPSSGGSSYTAPSSTVNSSRNYHQEATDAAARGDWDAVSRALAARQEKINAQGGNDRGTSNSQILTQLRQQYGASFDALSGGRQDYVKLNAGERLPFDTGYASGTIYKDKGWQDGVDYLDSARRLASSGDLDGAYDALMRRGFKMADTGSLGGGTSQDQAYALIHRLYNQSPAARSQYENELAVNRQRLQDHQTQFGLETRPELAGKRILSADNQYWILYDQNGTPAITRPNNQNSRRYSDDELALMYQYYGGSEDFSELSRQLHNLAVTQTGVGRLIDQEGNYASGTAVQPVSARDWTGLPQTDRYQDTDALRAILERINAGESYSGGSSQVPIDQRAQYLASLPTGSGGGTASGGSYGGGYSDYGYGGDNLSAYLRQMYAENLNAQLAALRAAYEQNAADYRAHDDLISQAYRNQRNQAAASNDLERMYMAEMGAMNGMNTGASGQLALAQSAAYQGQLADLLAAEGQDRAANDLALQKLAAGYRGDVASAQAQSSADLLNALYSEAVRQENIAREEARWREQLEYQRQQDAWNQQQWQTQWDYNLQADQRDSAYNLASTMLKSGVLPDSATLAAAGISQESAASLVQAYQAAALQSAKKSAKTGTSGGGNPGQTDTQVTSPGESGRTGGSPTANNTGNGGGNGSSYSMIWSRARTMFDQNKSTQEIMNYLNKFDNTQLTDQGLNTILSSLNLNGYRDNGR